MNESLNLKLPSIEDLRKKYKIELESILHAELTPENIEIFADTALDRLVSLVREMSSGNQTTKEQEDELFRQFDLANIPEVMDIITAKKQQIDELRKYISISSNKLHIDRVITPPANTKTHIEVGSGVGLEKKKIIPRLLTLIYILENDFQIARENVKITEGAVSENMMRQTPYSRIEIPELNRLIYVCDEEGNVSYIFDTEELKKIPDLTVEDVDLETKLDREEMLLIYPGIGISMIQTKNWRNEIGLYLSESIQELTKSSDRKQNENDIEKALVLVLKGELDPWRGFWADDEGNHWGSRMSIARKLKRSFIIFKKRDADDRLKTKIIGDLSNRPVAGYCYEQFISLFPEVVGREKIETSGEWKGFWIDPSTGKHWGNLSILRKKFGVKDWVTMNRVAINNKLPSVESRDLDGRITKAYSYEDFFEKEEFIDFLTAPQTENNGEWTGFLIDNEDRHWSSTKRLAEYFNTSSKTTSEAIKKLGLVSKKVKITSGEVVDAFCLEELKTNQEFMEFVKLPEVETKGEWTGFWMDQNGKHWGTVFQLSKKLKISRDRINALINSNPQKYLERDIRDVGGKKFKGYLFETLLDQLNLTKII